MIKSVLPSIPVNNHCHLTPARRRLVRRVATYADKASLWIQYISMWELMHASSTGKIGCAYHNPANFLIYVLEDTQETDHVDMTGARQPYKKILSFLTFSLGRWRSIGLGLA